MTVILAIVSFAPYLIGTNYPTKDLEWMTRPNEPLARPAATASATPSTYYEENPTKYLDDSINLAPIIDSAIEKPEPGIQIGFFVIVILQALAFVAAISVKARIMTDKAVRSYHLERRARLDLQHKLAQAEDEKAQLASQLLEMEEQRKEAVQEANDLREKLVQSTQKEDDLQQDLELSKEHIKGLQATVAKKGKEALEYRAQAYRTTREIPPTQMSRLRFGSGHISAPPMSPHYEHTTPSRDQNNHARSTESEVDDDGGRNVIGGGGSGESSVGKDMNALRYAPKSW